MVEVQRTVRTCEGCGLCCTEAFNSVRVLPVEGERIARHLATLDEARRRELTRRMERSITRFGLEREGKPRYTCPFLGPDLRCALPLDVKPVACLSFNPWTPDHCDQEPDWYESAHAEVERQNRAAGLPERKDAIPVAVRRAMKSPRRARQ